MSNTKLHVIWNNSIIKSCHETSWLDYFHNINNYVDWLEGSCNCPWGNSMHLYYTVSIRPSRLAITYLVNRVFKKNMKNEKFLISRNKWLLGVT